MPGKPQPPTRVSVRVTPRSSHDEIEGFAGETLHVHVSAPPDGGRANAAVCMLVAHALGVPKSSVTVIRGATARHKMIAVEGVDAATVRSRLGRAGRA